MFLRRCQGKRSRCIGKKTSGDYTEIKILCLKINRQMQTKIRDHLSGRGESASERRIYLPVRAGKV